MIAMSDIPKASRKQLADAIREGICPAICPECKSTSVGVGCTLKLRSKIRRYRKCDDCGHSWPTEERNV